MSDELQKMTAERDELLQMLFDHEKILRSVRDAADLHLVYIARWKEWRRAN